jgi:hypothetical protein
VLHLGAGRLAAVMMRTSSSFPERVERSVKPVMCVAGAMRLLRAGWVGRVCTLLFIPFAIAAVVALPLEAGIWKQERVFFGPFIPEPVADSRALVLPVGNEQAFRCCLEARSDNNGQPFRSDLRLWINDQEMGPAHSLHANIRRGESTAFSHWDSYVLFSLPGGVQNTLAVHAKISYTLRPRGSSTSLVLVLASTLWGLLLYRRTLRVLAQPAAISVERVAYLAEPIVKTSALALLRTPYLLLRCIGWLGVLASLAYIGFTVHAIASGWALPTTALIRASPIAEWGARNEPMLGHLLLALAGLGAAATWFAVLMPSAVPIIRREEIIIGRFFRRWGVLVAACLFVFSISAMWTGIERPDDLHGSSIGGLIGFSDAGGYWAGAHDQARDGTWSNFSMRRPIAAAFRTVLLFFAAYSTSYMLILQAFLLSAATCFAAYSVAKWRGIWPSVAFFGLVYIYSRIFAPTALTEPLGLIWALLAIPFFIQAFKTGSLAHALLGLGATSLALMSRMGSMFTIPALLLWLVWQFGRTAREKLAVLGLSFVVLLSVFAANFVLEKAYGDGHANTGTNFSYVLCGLTIGTTWDGCPAKISKEGGQLPRSEEAANELMYSLAAKNFKNDPTVLLGRLVDGSREFLNQLPDLLWRGYLLANNEPSWVPRTFLSLFSIFGVLFVLNKRRDPREIVFWSLLWASITSSAAIVFFDDGRRVMAASLPFISLFFAMGLTGPRVEEAFSDVPDRKLLRYGGMVVIVTGLLFFSVPWFAHRLSPIETLTGGALPRREGEAIIFGGRRITGFLIVPDDAPLRANVATLRLSEFERIVQKSGVEATYQALLHPETPPLPFGFVTSPRLEKATPSGYDFIVPAEVVERPEVRAWRLKITNWQGPTGPLGYGPYWFYATHAEPLQ